MNKPIQISDAEWEIMKVLWQQPGMNASEVTDALAGEKNWHPKTIRTMLNRLTAKGVLKTKIVDKLYRYIPTVSREECISAASTSFLNRVFDGAVTPMVAHFVDKSPLSKEDKEELLNILNKYPREDGE